jgi:hypothetical protein
MLKFYPTDVRKEFFLEGEKLKDPRTLTVSQLVNQIAEVLDDGVALDLSQATDRVLELVDSYKDKRVEDKTGIYPVTTELIVSCLCGLAKLPNYSTDTSAISEAVYSRSLTYIPDF